MRTKIEKGPPQFRETTQFTATPYSHAPYTGLSEATAPSVFFYPVIISYSLIEASFSYRSLESFAPSAKSFFAFSGKVLRSDA